MDSANQTLTLLTGKFNLESVKAISNKFPNEKVGFISIN